MRLPEEVAEKAVHNVTYFDVSDVNGLYREWKPRALTKDEPNCHFIFLNFWDVPSDSEKEYVVAHEIAHFFLKHGSITDISRNIEIEADRLVQDWGFIIPERRK